MLDKVSSEIRKKVYRHLAIKNVAERHGKVFDDNQIRKIRENMDKMEKGERTNK